MPNVTTESWAIVVEQSYATEDVVNTFGVIDQAVTSRDAITIAGLAGGAFQEAFDGLQVNELSYQRAVARQLVSPFDIGEATLTGTGEVTGEGMPGNTAVCVSLKTGTQGRSFRGRFYLSGVPLSPGTEADPNHMSSEFLANYNDAADDFVAGLEAVDLALTVISRFSGTDADGKPIPRATPIDTLVTSVVVNARLDSQRRRLGRS